MFSCFDIFILLVLEFMPSLRIQFGIFLSDVSFSQVVVLVRLELTLFHYFL